MSNISTHIQLMATDPLVELFELDCSQIGGVVYRFTPMTNNNLTEIQFAGQVWQPVPIQSDGFSYSGVDAPAKPTLTISNVLMQLMSPVISLNDLVGAKLTRYRTFERFLSTGSSPDATAYLPKDVFYISKKIVQNKINIQWELTSALDRSNAHIPRRLFLRRDFPGLANVRFRV